MKINTIGIITAKPNSAAASNLALWDIVPFGHNVVYAGDVI